MGLRVQARQAAGAPHELLRWALLDEQRMYKSRAEQG